MLLLSICPCFSPFPSTQSCQVRLALWGHLYWFMGKYDTIFKKSGNFPSWIPHTKCNYVLTHGFERGVSGKRMSWFSNLKLTYLVLWSPNCTPRHPRASYKFTEVLWDVDILQRKHRILNICWTAPNSRLFTGSTLDRATFLSATGISLRSHVVSSYCDLKASTIRQAVWHRKWRR